jgi:hypothetical protein
MGSFTVYKGTQLVAHKSAEGRGGLELDLSLSKGNAISQSIIKVKPCTGVVWRALTVSARVGSRWCWTRPWVLSVG